MQGPVDGPWIQVGDVDIYSLVPKDTCYPISALAEDSMLLPHIGPSGSATLAVCPAELAGVLVTKEPFIQFLKHDLSLSNERTGRESSLSS